MLSNAYFLAKFRFDTAEDEPAKNLQKLEKFAKALLSQLVKVSLSVQLNGAELDLRRRSCTSTCTAPAPSGADAPAGSGAAGVRADLRHPGAVG